MDVGLGLWTMRSTAEFPAPFPRLYAELGADARLAELDAEVRIRSGGS
jgi:hypothetical protein